MRTIMKFFILISCVLSFSTLTHANTQKLVKHNPKAIGVDFTSKQKPSTKNVKRTKANKANDVKKRNRTRPHRRFRR